MLSDAIVSLTEFGLGILILYLVLSRITFQYYEPVAVGSFILWAMYTLGGFYGRYNIAMIRFGIAKRKQKNG